MGKRLEGNGAKGRRIPRKNCLFTMQKKHLSCYYCKQKAHIAYRCLDHNRGHPREYSGQQRSGKWHQLEDVLSAFDPDAGKEGDEYCQLFCVNSSGGHNLYEVTELANGVNVTMEIDCIVNEKTFHYMSSKVKCWNSTLWILSCVSKEERVFLLL